MNLASRKSEWPYFFAPRALIRLSPEILENIAKAVVDDSSVPRIAGFPRIAGCASVSGVPGVANVPEVPEVLVDDHVVVKFAEVLT